MIPAPAPVPTRTFSPYNFYEQGKGKPPRTIKTEWVLNPLAAGTDDDPHVVLQVTTSHDGDHKMFRTFVGMLKRADTGRGFTSETYWLFDSAKHLISHPVARFSAKGLTAAHDDALALFAKLSVAGHLPPGITEWAFDKMGDPAKI